MIPVTYNNPEFMDTPNGEKQHLDEWSGDDAKMLTTLSDPQVVQVSSVEDGWNVSWQR